MSTTHFPNGVTNAPVESALASLIQLDPTLTHNYFNDFNDYTAGDWVVTETGAGGTQALTAGDGGLLLLTSDVLDNDGMVLQKTPAAFAFSASKRAWFSARFKMSEATQSDMQIGMVIVDTTPLDATDGIYFQKDDGDAQIDVYVRKNATTGSNSKTNIATLAADTYVTLSWFYNPDDQRLYYGVNGQQIGSMDASSSYLPDATNITVSMAFFNGQAGAQTMTVDYIFAAFER